MKTGNRILLSLSAPLAVLLTSCATPGGYASPEHRLPEGSTVELMQTLKLPPNSARVFVQDGVAMRGDDVNLWEPHCSFGLNRNRDGKPLAREIHPAKFTTGEVGIGVHAGLTPGGDSYAVPQGVPVVERVQVAGLFGGEGGAGTPWPYTYYTTIELYSDAEPQVDDLTCSFDGGPIHRNLTVDQIRRTLGDIARIY